MNANKRFSSRHVTLILLSGSLLLNHIASATAADSSLFVEVFTTADFPVIENSASAMSQNNMIRVEHYKIDSLHRLQEKLSEELPPESGRAKQRVLQRLGTLSPETNKAIEQAATGLAKAMQYGLDRFPAMVINGEVVMYGVTELAVAVRWYRDWQEQQSP